MRKKGPVKTIKARKKSLGPSELSGDFESLVVSIVQIHQQSREFASRAVNFGLTLRNWFIGHRIVEFEQNGAERAAYGERLLPALAKRLAASGLKQVDTRELRRFRLLYTVYPQIREAVTPELLAHAGASAFQPLMHFGPLAKRETLSPESEMAKLSELAHARAETLQPAKIIEICGRFNTQFTETLTR